jgi:hypothetical protein
LVDSNDEKESEDSLKSNELIKAMDFQKNEEKLIELALIKQ